MDLLGHQVRFTPEPVLELLGRDVYEAALLGLGDWV